MWACSENVEMTGCGCHKCRCANSLCVSVCSGDPSLKFKYVYSFIDSLRPLPPSQCQESTGSLAWNKSSVPNMPRHIGTVFDSTAADGVSLLHNAGIKEKGFLTSPVDPFYACLSLCGAKSLEHIKGYGTENEPLVGLASIVFQPNEFVLDSVLLIYSFTSGIWCLFSRLNTRIYVWSVVLQEDTDQKKASHTGFPVYRFANYCRTLITWLMENNKLYLNSVLTKSFYTNALDSLLQSVTHRKAFYCIHLHGEEIWTDDRCM